MAKSERKKESAHFWRDRDLNGLELLRATYVDFTYDRHVHNDRYALGVVLAGAESYYYRGQTMMVPAGGIVIIDPGEVHTGEAAACSGWTYRMLYPSVSQMQRAADQVAGFKSGNIPHFPRSVLHDPGLFAQIRDLHLALERSVPRLEKDSRLISALAGLVSRHASPRPNIKPAGREKQAVRLVRDYLHARYADNISLKELARLTNLNPYHLLRVFRREMGLPPHAYQNQFRLIRAKELLAAGHPIAKAALDLGFSDQSHLTRRFKAAFGVTPGQYARSVNFVQD